MEFRFGLIKYTEKKRTVITLIYVILLNYFFRWCKEMKSA
jgi:hypothetical protein